MTCSLEPATRRQSAMNASTRPPGGHDCPPSTKNPADQPKAPVGNAPCVDLPATEPPALDKPKPCPDPNPDCKCPAKPGSSPTCLEDMIADQAAQIAAAEKAKVFKTDLEARLPKPQAPEQGKAKTRTNAPVNAWVQ